MAEMLHYSRGGVQGPMTSAAPAQHAVVGPHQPAFATPWLPSGSDPQAGFVIDGGVRHVQAEPYMGAAVAAAEALGDDQLQGGRDRRRTPTGVAAPYQKAAAQRSAERALRPWDPISGAGERGGAALLQVAGANAGAGAFARPDAPSLFVAPSELQVAAVAAAAGRVTRGGQDQAAAEGAFSVQHGAPARELWPIEMFKKPPKYCTACRGGHEASKVGTTSWQPYTPAIRLNNLQLVDTRFRRAMRKGILGCTLSDSYWDAVRWAVQPQAMTPEQFRQQLVLAFEGAREGHEPFRFLATRAAEGLIACPGRGPLVVEAVPELVSPVKLCLNTMQPQLVGGALLLLIRLLRCHPSLPAALAPYCRHFLPVLAVFRSHRREMELPAPVCVAATGSFSGSGAPRDKASRTCRVCGGPLHRDHDAAVAREDAAASPTPPDQAAAAARKPLAGRVCGRYTLEALIEEVLRLLASGGGDVARRVVRSYIPTFNYYPPKDQPPCTTVEELREQQRQEQQEAAAAARRRPRSAPRTPTRRPATTTTTTTMAAAARPATAAAAAAAGGGGRGKKAAAVAARRPRRHSGGGGAPASWRSTSALSAADLARWDGMEFRDVPYGFDDGAVQQQASEPVAIGGSGGAPALRISTPVPVFDSPFDPLYQMLTTQYDTAAVAAHRNNSFTRAGAAQQEVAAARHRGGARRGGSGGGAPRANVNAEVPYKASPAGLRRAL